MAYFFTADEHYGHANIIRYCERPFSHVVEMDIELTRRHNEVVTNEDIVVHVGDFTLAKTAKNYLERLNGQHIFVRGSHDRWMPRSAPTMWEKMIEGQFIVACHYAMRTWPRSHYGSWQVYGHSHGKLPPRGNQWDVGVDNNDFYPVSFARLAEIMAKQNETDHESQRLT